MSCDCARHIEPGSEFVCKCDQFKHPLSLKIGAGLKDLPRQIAGFPEFRRAMLRSIGGKDPLEAWRARQNSDLGLMLIEMWAYVCDSLSLYDRVIAEESYVYTAKQKPSLRKLIALLGYIPKPAVASNVKIVATADGRLPVKLPAGMAFRSASFNGNPAQVFELDENATIHPLNNKWRISEIQESTIINDNPKWLLIQPKSEIKPFSKLLLLDYQSPSNHQVLKIKNAEPYTGTDGRKYLKLSFQSPARLSAGIPLSRLWLLMPDSNSILLEIGLLLESYSHHALYKVTDAVKTYGITNDYNWNHLDPSLPRHTERPDPDLIDLALRFNVPTAGIITNEGVSTISPGDQLTFDKRAEAPPKAHHASKYALVDKNSRGVMINGWVNFDDDQLNLNINENWEPDLIGPVEVFGNIIEASRGETVRTEILGSGNAQEANQKFKLSKKPLTYLHAPAANSETGVQNTLRIYVNGVKWKEVHSFYGQKPSDQIYIVRQDDNEESYVLFGDGIRGSLLPTGANNVVAYYRYGAGQASPPAGYITQIQTQVPGLGSIRNPVAGAGGSNAENKENLRSNAPKSALILGRAVSIQDMEAVALSMPGVRSVQAEWHWHGVRQCPVVFIWYIGESGIEPLLTQRLRSLTDPSTPIAVEQAMSIPTSIHIDIEIDGRYIESDKLKEIKNVLSNPNTGVLIPENLGIGQPLFRSRIFEVVTKVEGINSVRNILWNNQSFTGFAKTPGTGSYFDFENGKILLNDIV